MRQINVNLLTALLFSAPYTPVALPRHYTIKAAAQRKAAGGKGKGVTFAEGAEQQGGVAGAVTPG